MGALALAIGPVQTSSSLVLAALVDHVNDYAAAARSPNTRRAYSTDWRAFEAWCDEHARAALPSSPETLALYLAYLAGEGLTVSTIGRALSAISQAHKVKNHPSPRASALVSETFRGIRRTLGVSQRGKAPVVVADLKRMLEVLPDKLLGVRDRALLLVGFAGAFRRSELVGLDVRDVVFTTEGLQVTIRRSKTDQEGVGRTIGVPYGSTESRCPVRSLQAWLEALRKRGVEAGPIFRSVNRHGRVAGRRLGDRTVAKVVKRYASAAGLGKAAFAGHSLRSGFATSAAKAGKTERAIMNQTGHSSTTMVRRYIRDAELFTECAAVGLL